MSDHVCPQCSREYGREITFCPDDGTRLIGDPIAALEGSVIEGRFTVRELIATGGMGAVYLATQHSMGREIALKVLRPELGRSVDAVKRFMAEARLASRLTSPHTVTLYDFGRTADGMLFIAMELLQGATLRAALSDGGPMDESRAVRIGTQICESLGEAHEQGIVHRDIKPDNVFLLRPGTLRETVKVLDFGVAKSLEPVNEGPVTKTGMVCGTPDYMSPENVTGEGVTPASDVYSVGVLLYQMLTGQTPFTADSLVGVMVHHVQTPPRPLRSLMGGRPLTKSMEELVLRCLSKQPGRRPVDANALLRELGRVEQERVAGAAEGPRIGPGPGVARRACAPAAPAAPAAPTLAGTEESVHALRVGRKRRVAVAIAVCLGALAVGVAAALWPGNGGTDVDPGTVATTEKGGAPATRRGDVPTAVGGTPEAAAPGSAAAPGLTGGALGANSAEADAGPPAAVHTEPGGEAVQAPPAGGDGQGIEAAGASAVGPGAVAADEGAGGAVGGGASPTTGGGVGSPAAQGGVTGAGGGPAAVTPSPGAPGPGGEAKGSDSADRVAHVQVVSSPPGAQVFAGGRSLGQAPADVVVPAKGRTVTVRLDGYEPAVLRLKADGPGVRMAKLVPDERTALKKAAGDGLQ